MWVNKHEYERLTNSRALANMEHEAHMEAKMQVAQLRRENHNLLVTAEKLEGRLKAMEVRALDAERSAEIMSNNGIRAAGLATDVRLLKQQLAYRKDCPFMTPIRRLGKWLMER